LRSKLFAFRRVPTATAASTAFAFAFAFAFALPYTLAPNPYTLAFRDNI